ncbi:hypothetical protein DB42_AA00730 [Neochlamydia sp. EPS4]|nr:hypothetical protein DB42_AA00730 [Neochlamydia sp. EPS4]
MINLARVRSHSYFFLQKSDNRGSCESIYQIQDSKKFKKIGVLKLEPIKANTFLML